MLTLLKRIMSRLGIQHCYNAIEASTLKHTNIERLTKLTAKLNGVPELDTFIAGYKDNITIYKEGVAWCENLLQHDYIGVMVCTMKKGWTIATHKHSEEETGVVLKGKAEFRIGKKVIIRNEGQCITFKPLQSHSYRGLEDTEMAFVSIPKAKGY